MFLPYTHTPQIYIYINNNKGSKRKLGGDEYVYGFDGSHGFISTHIVRVIRFYTLKLFYFLHVNYASIKRFKKYWRIPSVIIQSSVGDALRRCK